MTAPPDGKAPGRDRTENAVAQAVRDLGRTSRRNGDPNDRNVDPDIVGKIKRMRPDALDRLLRGEDE